MLVPAQAAVKIICVSGFLLVLQAPAIDPTSFAVQVERLGLTGSLLVAVGVLWRSLGKKDADLQTMSAKAIDALAQNSDAQKELRKIVEESTIAKRELTTAIERLSNHIGTLPCSPPDDRSRKVVIERT